MNYDEAKKKLLSIGELALIDNWDSFTKEQQGLFLSDIVSLDIKILEKQKTFLKNHFQNNHKQICYSPFESYSTLQSQTTQSLGLKLIAEGKVGCLLVAGGQGSRLGFSGPKGLFPISPVMHKSLFQIFSEKVLAASKLAGRSLHLAIMTSPQNHDETLNFFKIHKNFGLDEKHLSFFSQQELPLLDDNGHLLLTSNNRISQGPDGNGSSLLSFVKKGLLDEWFDAGIEYVNFILIDNPLADPFDAALIGFHKQKNSDVTIKSIERKNPEESVGLIVNTSEGVRVIEYSEMDSLERKATVAPGVLKHRCTNISLFCFSLPFIKKAVAKQKLHWHLAYKKCGNKEKKGWKFETFIFDFLAYAKKVEVLLYPRSQCFAPLKNAQGDSSPKTVSEALQARDKQVLEEIIQSEIVFKGPIEIDQQFYYPNQDLLKKWQKKKPPTGGYVIA